MQKRHVSAAALLWLLSGCSAPDDRIIPVYLQAHSLASCPLPGPARLDLSALGDFPISNRTSESLSIDAAGKTLGFPADTLALEATANADLAQQPFIGYGERSSDRFDFLLWPKGTACDAFRPTATDSYPAELDGEALGFASSSGLVMVAGNNDAGSGAIVGALTFDTRTGTAYVVDPRKREVLSEPRAFATISDFAGKVLVAGGENPIHEASEPANVLRGTAEVYDPATHAFERDLLPLAEPVTRHAAATLANAETVLIGGRDQASNASGVVQVVSPQARNTKLLEPLNVSRNTPIVLRLTDDRILVGGGSDAAGHPVGAIEWRDSEAGKLPAPWDGSTALPARFDRAFVALPGGAALAVGGCEDRPALPDENCAAWCREGCPPLPNAGTRQSYDAFWIDADGTLTPLEFELTAPRPMLVPGSDGRPWLIASDVDQSDRPIPGSFALYRFDPWQKHFDAVDSSLGFNSTLSPTRLVATGTDAFVWLSTDPDGPALRGVRFGTRSSFSSDVPLVSLRDGSTRPAHLAPDHPPDGNVSYDAQAGVLSFSALDAGATPRCVWISDAEYGDFSAQIRFSSDTPPSLRLATHAITEPSSSNPSSPCQLPELGPPSAAARVLSLRRTGARLTLGLGEASNRCELDAIAPAARLPFAVCQSELGPVTITQISVTRG